HEASFSLVWQPGRAFVQRQPARSAYARSFPNGLERFLSGMRAGGKIDAFGAALHHRAVTRQQAPGDVQTIQYRLAVLVNRTQLSVGGDAREMNRLRLPGEQRMREPITFRRLADR